MAIGTVVRRISALLLPLALSLPGAAQRVPDVRVNNGPFGAISSPKSPEFVVDGLSIYVVWADDRNGSPDIYFNRSLDGGNTWLASDKRLNTNFAGSSLCKSPQIAASGNAVYVVWEDDRSGLGDIYFNRSLNNGTSWLFRDVRLDRDVAGSGNSFTPQVAASGNAVCVVWGDSRNAFDWDIYANRSTNNGSSWLPSDIVIAGSPGNARMPDITMSGSNVHVVWSDDVVGNIDEIAYARSPDNGTSWPTLVTISKPNNTLMFAANPKIAVSSSNVHVTWWCTPSFGDNDIWYNRSMDGGTSWLSSGFKIDRNSTGARSQNPDIAVAGSNVWVCYEDSRNLLDDIYVNHSSDNGINWLLTDIRMDTDAGPNESAAPRIAAVGTEAHVVWEDQRNGANDVRYNRTLDGGASWLAADLRIDTGSTPGFHDSNNPRVGLGNDRVYILWHDERDAVGGDGDIYFNITAGVDAYGVGKAGTGSFVPSLGISGSTTVGGAFTADVTNGLGGANGFLLIGSTGRMSSLPFLGGTLLVVPELVIALSLGGAAGIGGAGSQSVPLVIPNVPVLAGLPLFLQAMILDPGATFGASLSNGVAIFIG